MGTMTSEYWNELANQYTLISALLAGFSISFIANLVVSNTSKRLSNSLLITSTLAASCFLISIFSMTKMLMMTTEGYPLTIDKDDFNLLRIIGGGTFLIGIVALSTLIALAGWTKSKTIGIITTIVGTLTLLVILLVA